MVPYSIFHYKPTMFGDPRQHRWRRRLEEELREVLVFLGIDQIYPDILSMGQWVPSGKLT